MTNENKQKLIEEMGKVMCQEYGSKHCQNDCDCANAIIAERLYSAGYRKISDGAVILTREAIEIIREGYKTIRENTAREILAMFDDKNIITWDDLKKQIAKRYGVNKEKLSQE